MSMKLTVLVTIFALVLGANSTNETDGNITDYISFIYYYGNTFEENVTYTYQTAKEIIYENTFNKSATTVFFMHGYSEKPTEHNGIYSSDLIPLGFFKADIPRNLIVVDYQNLVQHFYNVTPWTAALNMFAGYVIAATNTVPVGKAVGNVIKTMAQECNCSENFHLIGFSLGCHVASNAAKEYGNGELPKITGLDPAKPMFESGMLPYLQKTDAKDVLVIHTDGGQLGKSQNCGTVDFRPNRGTQLQPSCSFAAPVKCSHYMAPKFFSISIYNPMVFVARKCDSYALWLFHFCDRNPEVLMGYYTPKNVSGQYYLRTSEESPYGEGRTGSLP